VTLLPGGYAPHALYNVTLGGGVDASFDVQVKGIAEALLAAHDDMRRGATLSLASGDLPVRPIRGVIPSTLVNSLCTRTHPPPPPPSPPSRLFTGSVCYWAQPAGCGCESFKGGVRSQPGGRAEPLPRRKSIRN